MCHSGDVCGCTGYPVDIINSKYLHLNVMRGRNLMPLFTPLLPNTIKTKPTVDHSLSCGPLYSTITILQSLWTWPRLVEEGWGLHCYTYQPDHVRLLDRPCVFRHSSAMQSTATVNQLQSVTLSRRYRGYTSRFWWTRTWPCDLGVKSHVLEPWTAPSCQVSIKRWRNVSTHMRRLSLLMRNGSKLDFPHYHKWADFWAVALATIFSTWIDIRVCVYLQFAFLD